MTTRVVTAQINKASGAPWKSAKVKFRLVGDTYLLSPDTSYPINRVDGETNASGVLSVTLASGLAEPYEVTMPDGEVFRIYVPAGSATTLEALRAAYDLVVPEPPADIEDLIAAVMAGAITDSATIDATYSAGPGTFSLAVIPDTSVQKTDVRKNSTGTVFSRRRLNLIEGSNVTLTVADDAGGNEVDVTIAAAGGGGGGGHTEFIVAANDATAAQKAVADYQCDNSDDHVQINAAIAALPTEGGVVKLVGKNFSTTAAITIHRGVTLMGEGPYKTTILSSSATAAIKVAVPTDVNSFIHITELGFYDNSGTTPIGIDARGMTRSTFDHIIINNYDPGVGIYFGGNMPAYAECWTNSLEHFLINDCGRGIVLEGLDNSGPATANANLIKQGALGTCSDCCIDIIHGRDNWIEAVDAGYQGEGISIRLAAKADNNYFHVRMESVGLATNVSGNHAVEIAAGAKYNTIDVIGFSDDMRRPIVNDAAPTTNFTKILGQATSAFVDGGYDVYNVDVAFGKDITVPDEVYDATAWNGSLEVPTKNAIRDKIEALLSALTVAGALAAASLNLGGATLLDILSNTKTWDPASVVGGFSATNDSTTLTITGAAVGDVCTCGLTTLTTQPVILSCAVSAANTVTATVSSTSSGATDLGSGTLRCNVLKI